MATFNNKLICTVTTASVLSALISVAILFYHNQSVMDQVPNDVTHSDHQCSKETLDTVSADKHISCVINSNNYSVSNYWKNIMNITQYFFKTFEGFAYYQMDKLIIACGSGGGRYFDTHRNAFIVSLFVASHNGCFDECFQKRNPFTLLFTLMMNELSNVPKKKNQLKLQNDTNWIHYQFEQVQAPYITAANLETSFLLSTLLLDFSKENIKQFSNKFLIPHLQLNQSQINEKYINFDAAYLYHPLLLNKGIYRSIHRNISDRPIDVLFFGTRNERRKTICTQMEKMTNETGVNMVCRNAFGEELFDLLEKTKILLNVHFYGSNEKPAMLEVHRINMVLSYKVAVVSEISGDKELQDQYEPFVTFSPYDRLLKKCLKLLQNETKIMELGKKGHEFITNRVLDSYRKNGAVCNLIKKHLCV